MEVVFMNARVIVLDVRMDDASLVEFCMNHMGDNRALSCRI